MKKVNRYQVKKRMGLVPSFHHPTDPSYHNGANNNWPRGMSEYARIKQAMTETPSANGYTCGHRFVKERKDV